jgi:fumarate reductase flavoprotein subunit
MKLNRRDFLKGSLVFGGAAAAAGAAGTLAACTSDSDTAPSGAAEGGGSQELSENSWLGTAPDLKVEDCAKTVQADVVVVGTALAGELAGYSAVKEGAKVVMLERNGTAHVSGSGIGFVNSKYQLDNGQPRHDEYEVIQMLFNQFEGRSDLSFISQWAFNSGTVLDELEENVLQAAGVPGQVPVQPFVPDKQKEIIQSLNSHVDFNPGGSDSLEEFNFAIHDWIKSNGGEIHYNTCARVLTQADDGTVTGVIATDHDGQYVYYEAANGVIVCTGSYGGNEEMMRYFANPWLARYAKEHGVYNARVTDKTPITTDEIIDDGLGHKMMCWVGAVMEEIDPSFQSWEDSGYYWWPYLHVTVNGERFRNEACSWLSHTHQIAERPENVNYYWQIRPTNDFKMPMTVQTGVPLEFWEQMLTETMEWYEADTIEELAKLIDVPTDTLSATVKRYNDNCQAGFDADWGKLPKYLDPIDDPPYRAVKATIHFYCTSSGVKCNDKLQVLDKDWKPIPNLYAAGNTVGWRLGSGYQMVIPGLCNAFAFFHGYVAGKHAANPNWTFADLKK